MLYISVDRDSWEKALANIRSKITQHHCTATGQKRAYKKIIFGGFDSTDSNSLRIYSNYHPYHHHHHQSLLVLEIVL